MQGRKTKPAATKRREGNAGKRRLGTDLELARAARGLECPPGLPAAAKALWEEIVPPLDGGGILHAIDRAALTNLCLEWAAGVAAHEVLQGEGMISVGSMGQLVAHPMNGEMRASHAMFLRYAEQFALTSAARARVSAILTGGSGDGDVLDMILNRPPEEL